MVEGGGERGALFSSADGGISWERALSGFVDVPPLNAVAFSGDEGWVVGDVGGCYHTEDGGDAWAACGDNFITLDLNRLHVPANAEETSWLVGAGAIIIAESRGFSGFYHTNGHRLGDGWRH